MAHKAVAKGRIGYFDAAKGVAIIAVVAGHTALRCQEFGLLSKQVIALTFSFHLPLFFMVSGYFLHVDRPFRWRRELRALCLPYIVTCLVVIFLIGLTGAMFRDYGVPVRVAVGDWVSAAFAGSGGPSAHPPLAAGNLDWRNLVFPGALLGTSRCAAVCPPTFPMALGSRLVCRGLCQLAHRHDSPRCAGRSLFCPLCVCRCGTPWQRRLCTRKNQRPALGRSRGYMVGCNYFLLWLWYGYLRLWCERHRLRPKCRRRHRRSAVRHWPLCLFRASRLGKRSGQSPCTHRQDDHDYPVRPSCRGRCNEMGNGH